MAFQFKFPDVGEGITEGVLVKWLVKEGDEVRADDSIAEVETDKAVVELPSPRTGKILKLAATEGSQITVGQVIVEIEEHEDSPDTANQESVGVVGDLSSDVTIIDEAPEPEEPTPAPTPAPTSEPSAPPSGIKKQRKYDMWGYIDHIPYQGTRKSIGEHMVKSAYTAPHVTHMGQADVTDLVAIRKEEKKKAAQEGIKVTFMPFIMKATIKALQEHPYLNATLDEENADIILKKYYNIGFAVDTEHGLMAPVIKRAENKTILEFAKELEELAEKARKKELDPMDMKGGTFTITNIGSYGGVFATPIINYPEVAILGLGRINDAPLVVDGEIKVRQVLPLSLTYDHRVIDGAEAARFLKTVIAQLEKPSELLD